MAILGISAHYHDSRRGARRRRRARVRRAGGAPLSRRKNDAAFPLAAIEWCLDRGGRRARRARGRGLLREADAQVRAHPHDGAARLPALMGQLPARDEERARREALGEGNRSPPSSACPASASCSPTPPAHAAAAFLDRAATRAAILTADGVGEWATLTVGRGVDRRATAARRSSSLRELRFPHSLGMLYSTFTAYLGFEVNEGEYKVMGLASYGKPRFEDAGTHGCCGARRTGPSRSTCRISSSTKAARRSVLRSARGRVRAAARSLGAHRSRDAGGGALCRRRQRACSSSSRSVLVDLTRACGARPGSTTSASAAEWP